MTYLEKWFDFNRRQVELEALLEQTIAEQSDQSLTLKEFYLLHFLNQAQEKSLRQIDLPDKLHLSPSAVSRMVARLEAKTVLYLVGDVVTRISELVLSASLRRVRQLLPIYKKL